MVNGEWLPRHGNSKRDEYVPDILVLLIDAAHTSSTL